MTSSVDASTVSEKDSTSVFSVKLSANSLTTGLVVSGKTGSALTTGLFTMGTELASATAPSRRLTNVLEGIVARFSSILRLFRSLSVSWTNSI